MITLGQIQKKRFELIYLFLCLPKNLIPNSQHIFSCNPTSPDAISGLNLREI